MDLIKLVQGDQLPALRFTLKDASLGTPCKPNTWPALDLSTATVTIRVINSATRLSVGNMDVVVDDPLNGSGYATWADTLAEPGDYEAEIGVTFGTATLTIYDTQPVHVRPKD